MISPRWLQGKVIERVEMHPYVSHGVTMHQPRIVFTDGTALTFYTEEDPDGGEYGTGFTYLRRRA